MAVSIENNGSLLIWIFKDWGLSEAEEAAAVTNLRAYSFEIQRERRIGHKYVFTYADNETI